MTFRDWFLFISTFVVAVLCGMYLYFTTFVPEYVANPAVQSLVDTAAPDWTLTATEYGGCTRLDRCARFEVTNQGMYRYQQTAASALREGSLPRALRRSLSDTVAAADIAALSQRVAGASCRSFVDGLDYELTHTSGSAVTALDTCGTALDYQSPLTLQSAEVFRYLASPDEYAPTVAPTTSGRRGLSGIIERKLDETFDYDD